MKSDFKSIFDKLRELKTSIKENVDKGDFDNKDKQEYRFERKNIFGPFVAFAITVVIMFLYFFFALPSLNPMSPQLYSFIAIGTGIFLGLRIFFGSLKDRKIVLILISIIVTMIFIPIFGSFISTPIFRAKSYSKLIDVEKGVFEKEISQIGFDQIPVVDRSAAYIIGSKQMGVMTELVSQFEIDDRYSQVNIKGKPIRVSPLNYSDFFKYLSNYKQGIPAYVRVDMTSQEASVTRLDKAIFYSKSDLLFRNINRHIRFSYPFEILAETNFELDDTGHPYYVTPILTKRIGFFNGVDVKSVIITDANTGENKRYSTDEVPAWVDRVFPASTIISQLNSFGKYKDGFINTLFSQKNVTKTTDGYNYISIGEDIYLITGVTSVRSDESNLGFYFVNLRTKETKFYPVSSATESAAMASAKGKVQEKNYTPTFPIVLNLNNRPVYFMSLKDNAGVAKMYALVDAQQFTVVLVEETVDKLISSYMKENSTDDDITESSRKKTIVIEDIKSIIVEGNTVYYIKARGEDKVYLTAGKTIAAKLVFKKAGDKINIVGNEFKDGFHILDLVE